MQPKRGTLALMKGYLLTSLFVLGLALGLSQTTLAYTYSSTYTPYLYINIDGSKVGSDVVLRAHRNAGDLQEDHVYACNGGRCAFSQNAHETETEWNYFIERLNKKIPKEKINKPKAVEKFYLEQAEVKLSQDITGSIKELSFAATEKKVDYVVNVNTKKGKVNNETFAQGDYVPGDDGLAIGEVNVSPNTVKIGIAILVIVIIYGAFKLFPMGHH